MPDVLAPLTNLCKEGQTINIFSEGTLSNRNREDSQVGTASAVL